MSQHPPAQTRLDAGSMPIPFSGCRIWYRASVPSGYGVIFYQGRQTYAHRVAWELANGPIPDGMFVCHACDTPSCVNPAHLFLGSPKDNAQDMSKKGRANGGAPRGDRNPVRLNPSIVSGENSGNAKLSNADVLSIRRLHSIGWTQIRIAERFNISRGNVARIVLRQAWRHI